jgi:spore coat polysaccharide biosynthesis predicted glycosyltransferase SpsG
MKFLLKTEASKSIGMGHLARLSKIAEILKSKNHTPIFASIEALPSTPYKSIQIQSDKDFKAVCKDSDAVIIDEPSFQISWLTLLPPDYPVIAIDELTPLREKTTLHICTTLLGLDNSILKTKRATREFIGPAFFVFPSKKAPVCNLNSKKIMLSFGGTDPGHILESVLEYLSLNPIASKWEWLPVLGKGYTSERKEMILEKWKGFHYISSPDSLSELMGQCSFALVSGGITPYECLRHHCFPLCIAQNEEQQGTIDRFVQKNLALSLGSHDTINWRELESVLTDSANPLYSNAGIQFENLLRGDSTDRTVRLIIHHAKSQSLQRKKTHLP